VSTGLQRRIAKAHKRNHASTGSFALTSALAAAWASSCCACNSLNCCWRWARLADSSARSVLAACAHRQGMTMMHTMRSGQTNLSADRLLSLTSTLLSSMSFFSSRCRISSPRRVANAVDASNCVCCHASMSRNQVGEGREILVDDCGSMKRFEGCKIYQR
jgi:hypothetical protein